MFFKAAVAGIAILAVTSGFLYWRVDYLSQKLESEEIRGAQARAALSQANAAISILERHSADLRRIAESERDIEKDIQSSGAASDPLDPDTIAFLRRLGVFPY